MPSTIDSKKGAEFGATLAKRRSQDFKSKIESWNDHASNDEPQEKVAATKQPPNDDKTLPKDTSGVDNDKSSGHSLSDPSQQAILNATVATRLVTRQVDLKKRAWVRKKSRPQVELAEELKEAVSPKKRIVSDGHWRKDQARNVPPSPQKNLTPSPDVAKIRPSNQNSELSNVVKKWAEAAAAAKKQSDAPAKTNGAAFARASPKSDDRKQDQKNERNTKDNSDSPALDRPKGSGRGPSTQNQSPASLPVKLTTPHTFRLTTSATSFLSGTSLPSTSSPSPKHGASSASDGEYSRALGKRASSSGFEGETLLARPRPQTADRTRQIERNVTAPANLPVFGKRIEGWLLGTPDPGLKVSEVSPESLGKKIIVKEVRRDTKVRAGDPHNKSSSLKSSQPPGLDRTRGHTAHERPAPAEFPQITPSRSTKPMLSDMPGSYPRNTSSHETTSPAESLVSRASDGDERRQRPDAQRRLAKHSDLISVLSLAKSDDNKAIRSARSLRARRSARASRTVENIMNVITTEELKYQHELRTLVDGVIPVLLTHALKDSKDGKSGGTNRSAQKTGRPLTQPIVEMGVALERIKSLHRNIPLHKHEDFVTWASGALKAYTEYVTAWRLGFREIQVNLASADDSPNSQVPIMSTMRREGSRKSKPEPADVAYLLKRPFVRLKNLTKALESINQIQSTPSTERIYIAFSDLLNKARQKASDERARLEDEAAAGIDATRARDPRSLASIAGVLIDSTRHVKARDLFDLDLIHSSGQQIVCQIEMIARDDAPRRGTSGDILICEAGLAGRWLLFPPISVRNISARHGEKDGEMVVMLRGNLTAHREWRELILLRSQDAETVDDWLDILGSSPMPSRLSKHSSFQKTVRPRTKITVPRSLVSESDRATYLSATSEEDLPMGEQARDNAHIWDGSEVNTNLTESEYTPSSLRRVKAVRHRSNQSHVSLDSYEEVHAQVHARSFDEHDVKRMTDRRDLRSHNDDTHSSASVETYSQVSSSQNDYSVWLPSESGWSDESSQEDDENAVYAKGSGSKMRENIGRGNTRGKGSSAQSSVRLNVPRLRSPEGTQEQASRQISMRHSSGSNARSSSTLRSPKEQEHFSSSSSRPSTGNAKSERTTSVSTKPQQTPPTRHHINPSLVSGNFKKHRRTSSPLKHEYHPSSDSHTSDGSSFDTDDDYGIELDEDIESVTSESSTETTEEGVSTIGDLKGFQQYASRPLTGGPISPPILSPVDETSLGPSDSASQGPYRSVPATGEQYLTTFASLFSWSEAGAWTNLHPEECAIFVSPGLIEAFDVAQAGQVKSADGTNQQSPSHHGVRPLVALELTPLVPLRRGTAVDITIRSPPTSNSMLRFGNNIMFRSRGSEECDALYALLNRARIDNPTYIALQRARGPIKTSNWGEIMDRQNAARTSSGSSWWPTSLSRKGSTYRSKGSRGASTAATESSIATVDSAFSALRRFSSKSRFFNIGKSTMTFREGTRSTTSDSLSSGLTSTPLTFDSRLGTPMGATNTKIRLYLRESSSRWRDLGSATMTVMMPPRDDPAIVDNPRATGNEKRILVHGKSRGEVLLHAVLPETSFERVARTGIAVSVWQETCTPAAIGGVGSATLRVYMVQMKTEREAAFTFGLVGKLRY